MKKYLFLLLMAMPFCFTSCSSDDDDASVSKSELMGTWYTLEDDEVLVFTETTATYYELWNTKGKDYALNPYTISFQYSLNGNQVVAEDGSTAKVSINGNILKIISKDETATYTKFNGSPKQLIDYLNK